MQLLRMAKRIREYRHTDTDLTDIIFVDIDKNMLIWI